MLDAAAADAELISPDAAMPRLLSSDAASARQTCLLVILPPAVCDDASDARAMPRAMRRCCRYCCAAAIAWRRLLYIDAAPTPPLRDSPMRYDAMLDYALIFEPRLITLIHAATLITLMAPLFYCSASEARDVRAARCRADARADDEFCVAHRWREQQPPPYARGKMPALQEAPAGTQIT